jgi:hypothetical protein
VDIYKAKIEEEKERKKRVYTFFCKSNSTPSIKRITAFKISIPISGK